MNWKTLVEEQNAKTYVIPAGWDERETVAEQLECSPERVAELLRPAIKAGEVESQQFRVWSPVLKRVGVVTAYRRRPTDGDPKPAEPRCVDWTGGELARARALRLAGKSWSVIAQTIGRSAESVRSRLRRRLPKPSISP